MAAMDDFECRSCGWASGLVKHYPVCGNCGKQLTGDDIDFGKRDGVNTMDPFIPYFSFTADRQFNSRTDRRAWESELAAKGQYIRGGKAKSNLPSEIKARKNIAQHGPKWLDKAAHDPKLAEGD